jgi:P-type Cu+ transporter
VSTRRVDTVVLDKTGTVTRGQMTLVASDGEPGALRLAAAVERGSEHPIGRAIAAAVDDAPSVERFVAHTGLGAEGEVEGRVVIVGRPALLAARGIALGGDLDDARRRHEALGRTVVAVAADGVAIAVLAVADELRPTSAGAVAALRALGLRPLLLTGDNRVTAAAVADALGIDEVISEVLPDDKARVITRLQAEGRVVAMVGDGINDAPALATADLGIAMGSGSDIAMATADLTLVRSDPMAVATAIRLARATLGTIRGNLFWAFAYNVAAIPVAAAGLLEPMFAGFAMVASSLFVAANSLRLHRFRA